MAEEIRKVFGMNVRIIDVYPKEIIGVNNGRFVTWFWQGAEAARIYPAPNKVLHADGAFCACKMFIPSYESTVVKCRNCGKPPRR